MYLNWMKSEKSQFVLLLVILFFTNCIIFSQIFPSFFFADDFYFMTVFRGFSAYNVLFDIVKLSTGAFFTPIPAFIGWLSYQLFGLNSSGYYLFHFAFHFLNAVLLYFLLRKASSNSKTAFVGSLLFIVYCGNWEALGWGLNHMIYAFFLLLTLLAFAYSRYLWALSMFILAVLCHETAVVMVPLLVVLFAYFINKDDFKAIVAKISPYLAASLFFLLFKLYREMAVTRFVGAGSFVLGWHALPNYLNFISTLVFPVTLSYRASSLLPLFVINGILFVKTCILLLFPLVLFCAYKYGNSLVKYLISAFMLVLVPYSFFDSPIVSRYMYEASLFFIGFCSVVIAAVLSRKDKIKYFGAALLLVFFFSNLGAMLAYQKILYNKKEIRRQIVNELLVSLPQVRTGSTLCFIDLPIRGDEIKGMLSLWFKDNKYALCVINPDNVAGKQTFDPRQKYAADYIFVYDWAYKRLKLVKDVN